MSPRIWKEMEGELGEGKKRMERMMGKKYSTRKME